MAVSNSPMDFMTKDFQALIFEVKYLCLGGTEEAISLTIKIRI